MARIGLANVPLLQRKSFRQALLLGCTYLLLLAGAFVLMVPFGWMIGTSLKTLPEAFEYPPTWIPRQFLWRNYVDGWNYMPFTLYLKNTVTITALTMLGQVTSASLVAYAFARIRAPGRDLLFLVVLSTMMLPEQVTMIPRFVLFRQLGWYNTFKPLVVPAYFGGGAFAIFLLRQFYMTLPLELDDAATIDGCGRFRIFWSIILPLSKPALGTIAIFAFFGNWNDLMGPLIYLRSPEKRTLALGLTYFRDETGQTMVPWNLLMAVSLLVALPCLAVFFLFQRSFVQGIALTGIKG
jgi:ABC-type glycerol-3-phosphate transport system permease component